ncbi:hypothetical protein DPEC_G00215180 [Dallia pectoralis]|uniref:Uncharacterized protein n=1 Tax=Dallia pectoralis TaxID=75939 RepID=A0ACC2G2D8_DALPE|nr:hypothetical protein DPEC_G00215180 [Dallia pectoralis]
MWLVLLCRALFGHLHLGQHRDRDQTDRRTNCELISCSLSCVCMTPPAWDSLDPSEGTRLFLSPSMPNVQVSL